MRELLAEQGHSLRWLADQIGVNIAHLVRIGQGNKKPSTRLMIRTAEALGVPLVYFREVREEVVWRHLTENPLEMNDLYEVATRSRKKHSPAPKKGTRPS